MPWVAITTDPTGGYKPCCWMDNARVFRGPLHKYESSKYLTEIKEQFLNGEYPDICARCEWNDTHGLVSKRQRENAKFSNISLENQLYSIVDLRLSNKCNLSCATCNPKSSSSIYTEVEQNPDHQSSYVDIYNKIKKFDLTNPYSDEEIDLLIESIDPTARVYFTGGEPSLVKPAFRILERLLDKGYNKTVSIEFNSNFQALNSKWISMLSNFKGLAMPSIDAVGEQAELIRYGCNWNSVDTNLRTFIAQCPNFKIMLYPTVSILNVFYLKDIVTWADTLDGTVELTFNNRLNHPEYYNIKNMPQRLKDNANKYLKDVDANIIKHLNANADDVAWNDFINNMDKLDAIRNTKWRKVLEKLV
jgi:sulfatase maturation enzyme AslB (radical SAM superfamily)